MHVFFLLLAEKYHNISCNTSIITNNLLYFLASSHLIRLGNAFFTSDVNVMLDRKSENVENAIKVRRFLKNVCAFYMVIPS